MGRVFVYVSCPFGIHTGAYLNYGGLGLGNFRTRLGCMGKLQRRRGVGRNVVDGEYGLTPPLSLAAQAASTSVVPSESSYADSGIAGLLGGDRAEPGRDTGRRMYLTRCEGDGGEEFRRLGIPIVYQVA